MQTNSFRRYKSCNQWWKGARARVIKCFVITKTQTLLFERKNRITREEKYYLKIF